MLEFADDQSVPSGLLTIIITTSPVPSCPRPDLIKNNLASLPPPLLSVPTIITFDGFNIQPDGTERLKKGYVSKDLADRYPEYIDNVCNLFGEVLYVSENDDCTLWASSQTDVRFLKFKRRNGFGFSVKIALQHVKTPYIMVLQHDWVFVNHPPMLKLLSILHTEENVNYICFVTRFSINYELSKGESSVNYRYVFKEARNIRRNYTMNNELIACLHWFDRPHLCSTETYRKLFEKKIVRRGDFIEDTFGTEYLQSIMNAPSREVAFGEWQKWRTWMYYPNDGQLVTLRHQHGRVNLLGEQQDERIKKRIEANHKELTSSDESHTKIDEVDDVDICDLVKNFFEA